jgi:hypothetical protein
MLCGGGGQDLTLRGGAPEGERIQHPAKAMSRQLYVGAEPRRGWLRVHYLTGRIAGNPFDS